MIDITGLDKAEILMALYNRAKTQGLGFIHYDPTPMNLDDARQVLTANAKSNSIAPFYFDYLRGRVMKVNFEGNMLNEQLYDRDNGIGTASNALSSLKGRKL